MKELFLVLLILICFFDKDGFNEKIDRLLYFKIIIICSVYCIIYNIDKKESLEVEHNNPESISSVTSDAMSSITYDTAKEAEVAADVTTTNIVSDTRSESLIKNSYNSGVYTRLNRTEIDIGLNNEHPNYQKKCLDQNLQFDETKCYYKGEPMIIKSEGVS